MARRLSERLLLTPSARAIALSLIPGSHKCFAFSAIRR
jgi:hypothetical protein